jgi:uncharacterized protein YeaO (DUF488 family)
MGTSHKSLGLARIKDGAALNTIRIKRVYDPPAADDGQRFLVDRLWPRGMKREALQMAGWTRDAAPSNELRHWYGHDPAKWEEFQARYSAELDAAPQSWQPILEAAQRGDVTLLYSSVEREINNAAALRLYLLGKLKG